MSKEAKLNDPTHPCDMPCGGNAAEKCGGSCSLTMFRVECSSNWGWFFLLFLSLGAAGYVGGFVGYNHKALGKPLGTEALPHPEFWVAGYGLAVDGAVFVSERVKQAIAEHRGEPYTPLPEADTAAGPDAEDEKEEKEEKAEKGGKMGGGGVVKEERDETVHSSQQKIKVVLRQPEPEPEPEPAEDDGSEDSLVE